MALKTWIDEIKTAERVPKSEAPHEPANMLDGNLISGESSEPSTIVGKRINAILTLTIREIEQNLNGVQYRSTSETKTAEENVNRIAMAILSGNSLDFDSLYQACSCWVAAARQKPTLFEGSNK